MRFLYNGTEISAIDSKFALISWYCDLVEQNGIISVLFPEDEDAFICMLSSAIEREIGKLITVPNKTFQKQCDYLIKCLHYNDVITLLE